LRRASSKAAVAELVRRGELIEVQVCGWEVPAYLWHAARRPRTLGARALLSPFDSLVFFRPRTERLFGVRYRIEIYTPAPQRIHGYYVLPFLLDEQLAARVDLKSDRQAQVLIVQGAYGEADIDPEHVAGELAAELRLCAGWLGLAGGVRVADRGDLASTLADKLPRLSSPRSPPTASSPPPPSRPTGSPRSPGPSGRSWPARSSPPPPVTAGACRT
jgi:uncharacterized protein YcaQ